MFRRAKKRKSSQTGIFRFFHFMPIWEYLPSKMSLCKYFPFVVISDRIWHVEKLRGDSERRQSPELVKIVYERLLPISTMMRRPKSQCWVKIFDEIRPPVQDMPVCEYHRYRMPVWKYCCFSWYYKHACLRILLKYPKVIFKLTYFKL